MSLHTLQRTISLLILLVCGLPGLIFAQQVDSHQQQAILLQKVLAKNHYSPRPLDDRLSNEIFQQFIELLDPEGLYFNHVHLGQLSAYRLQLDDELQGKSWKFLPLASQVYKQRLLEAEKIVTTLLQKPLDFSKKDTISFTQDDSLYFAEDEQEYVQRWNRRLKYLALQGFMTSYEQNHQAAGTQDKETTLLTKEPLIRQKLLASEKRTVNRILEHPDGYENYIASLFCSAISSCYDPHSSYFSNTEWENFQARLSSESLSFGIDLEENASGEISIGRLVPGGPAWKSNELHKDDVITALKWTDKTPVDLMGADLDEAESILQASNSGSLEITVKKTNGITKTVSLLKAKLREEENIVRSYILNGKHKIGYISLPGFYTEWENTSGMGCANDVAKEVVKLKQANIEGLILDIRYNGGGSLSEGLNLAGIFINEGPLCVLQARKEKPSVMKDMNRGTIYDGPLVLMINGQSASASEILASTLQDYNRALIVGSTSFGKSTGQVVLPLDTMKHTSARQVASKANYGFTKVTIEKLYRVTGKSAQLHGVLPDVYLPDMYEALSYREASLPFVLPTDSVSKKIYYTPASALPAKELARKSSSRVAAHSSFTLIQQFIDARKKKSFMASKQIPLQVKPFFELMEEKYQWRRSLEEALVKSAGLFSVENTSYDKQVMSIDTYSQEINKVSQENIQQDIYIEETYQIMADLISLTATK